VATATLEHKPSSEVTLRNVTRLGAYHREYRAETFGRQNYTTINLVRAQALHQLDRDQDAELRLA